MSDENHAVGSSAGWNVGVDMHGRIVRRSRREVGGRGGGGSGSFAAVITTNKRDVVSELEDDM